MQLSLEQAIMGKKKMAGSAVDSAKKKQKLPLVNDSHPAYEGVNSQRIRVLQPGDDSKPGPVIYYMFRDQRSRDNWALIHAQEQARKKNTGVAVVFNLLESFLGAKARQFGFLLRGLRAMEQNLKSMNIPFFLIRVRKRSPVACFFTCELQGEPGVTIPEFVQKSGASMLVMDFSPLRIVRGWHSSIVESLPGDVCVHEVDAHNVVPLWVASDKLEYGARTIRKKIQILLPHFLVDYPAPEPFPIPWPGDLPETIDWDALIDEVIRRGAEVPEVNWCEPGEDAALRKLTGEQGFVSRRLRSYNDNRNDPSKAGCLSELSPYLHFGNISAQRCAFEVRSARRLHAESVDSFLEELIIRRELSDNFCYYQPNYDNIRGAWDWARKTLQEHAGDRREHIYTREQLEQGKTFDKLWNASQLEMVHRGKMHGFMRMYWAKKILEWTETPEQALSVAIYLNDKYELDGRDPNGYVGCMWSICGVHDQGWKERPIFGKIRYMNYEGCKRKFNVDAYISYVNKLVSELRRAA